MEIYRRYTPIEMRNRQWIGKILTDKYGRKYIVTGWDEKCCKVLVNGVWKRSEELLRDFNVDGCPAGIEEGSCLTMDQIDDYVNMTVDGLSKMPRMLVEDEGEK